MELTIIFIAMLT